MKNTSVTLSDHFQQFVDTQVNQGHYASTSEVIRAGLRLLEEQEIHNQRLRDEILKGIQSGISPRSIDDIWNDELQALKQ
jgi:antitoxin ParD1/3/4